MDGGDGGCRSLALWGAKLCRTAPSWELPGQGSSEGTVLVALEGSGTELGLQDSAKGTELAELLREPPTGASPHLAARSASSTAWGGSQPVCTAQTQPWGWAACWCQAAVGSPPERSILHSATLFWWASVGSGGKTQPGPGKAQLKQQFSSSLGGRIYSTSPSQSSFAFRCLFCCFSTGNLKKQHGFLSTTITTQQHGSALSPHPISKHWSSLLLPEGNKFPPRQPQHGHTGALREE